MEGVEFDPGGEFGEGMNLVVDAGGGVGFGLRICAGDEWGAGGGIGSGGGGEELPLAVVGFRQVSRGGGPVGVVHFVFEEVGVRAAVVIFVAMASVVAGVRVGGGWWWWWWRW